MFQLEQRNGPNPRSHEYDEMVQQIRNTYRNPLIYEIAGIFDLQPAFKRYRPYIAPSQLLPVYKPAAELEELINVGEFMSDLNLPWDTHSFIPNGISSPRIPWLKPFIKDGLATRSAKTQIVQRLWTVHQLGPHQYYPMASEHTRAEHSIFVTTMGVGIMQALYDDNPNKLIDVLRRDLSKYEIEASEGLDESRVLEQSVQILVTAAMLHDSQTYAGGDAFKFLIRRLNKIYPDRNQVYREEDLLRQVLQPEKEGPFTQKPFSDYRDEAIELASTYGFDSRHWEMILECVEGKSKTLVGELLNPPEGDKFEADRLGYTIDDLWAAGLLIVDWPNYKTPSIRDSATQYTFVQGLLDYISSLKDPSLVYVSGISGVLPWNTLDPAFYGVSLTDKGMPVYSADIIAAAACARCASVIHHYCGPKLLGIERELETAIINWVQQHQQIPDFLDPQFLIAHGDKELYDNLYKLPNNKEIAGAIEGLGKGQHTLYEGYYAKERRPELFADPITVEVGICGDTLVQANTGNPTSFSRYCFAHPRDLLVDTLDRILEDCTYPLPGNPSKRVYHLHYYPAESVRMPKMRVG